MDDGLKSSQRRSSFLQFTFRGLAIVVAAAAIVMYILSLVSGTRLTGRDLDVAILGRGYFRVSDSTSGEIYYTRHGRLSINADGGLKVGPTSNGWSLAPGITIPPDWTSINIDKNGSVAIMEGSTLGLMQIGSIQLATFTNNEGLQEVVPNLYAETEASGVAVVGNPGTSGIGFLQQGWLESSPKFLEFVQVAIAGVCLIVFVMLLCEIRSLHRRLDDVVAQISERR